PEVGVGDAEPRVGLLVCRCGINIAAVVDVPALAEYGRGLPGVVHAEEMLFACSQDNQERIKALVREHRLNRLVVASCSPRTHEPLFRQTIREAGLNKYLFTMTNIREQCSWVHAARPREAGAKARDLVRMAVAGARLLRELHERPQPVRQGALVIGGGLAGMTAALAVRRLGFPVTLVERDAEMGGNLRRLRRTIDGDDVRRRLEALVAHVTGEPGIAVLRPAFVVGSSGFIGNFTTDVMVGPGGFSRTIEHGVTIVATGARELAPNGWGYGADPRVVTMLEFEERLEDGRIDAASIRHAVMVLCAGSRNAERPYCSRVCCQAAVKNAMALKARNPAARVTVAYRDVRTYGLLEEHYARARRAGVVGGPARARPEV
ncbi:MAG: NAD(P)-binding protein, partial [Myxococcota bacterium]|nr:NAD(P)-binding protein [Myxococcota bacterium]